MGRKGSELEKPEWFNLQNYSPAEDLDLSGWFIQLFFRFIVKTEMPTKSIHKYINQIKAEPIFSADVGIKILAEAGLERISKWKCERESSGDWKSFFEDCFQDFLGVTAVSKVDCCLIFSVLAEDWSRIEFMRANNLDPFSVGKYKEGKLVLPDWMQDLQKFEKKRMAKGSDWADIPESIPSWIFAPACRVSPMPSVEPHPDPGLNVEPIVAIDLRLPDKLLVHHFQLFLEMQRRMAHRVEPKHVPFKDGTFIKWQEHALLPYIDLRIWERTLEKGITQAKMDEFLFPGKSGIGEKIRRTTGTLAKSIMTHDFIKAMASGVAVEAASVKVVREAEEIKKRRSPKPSKSPTRAQKPR